MFDRATAWLALAGLTVVCATAVQAQDDPAAIVSAAVRGSGHDCAEPARATPDPEASQPDEEAWIVHCESGAFRVTFKGDEGAEVEPLNE